MADAGKVAILPRGLWNAKTVYEPLDLVYHNNNSFVALKESVGVTPVDGETWMLSVSSIGQETIDAIINGNTPVGDSAKLGGETAETWQGKIDSIQTTSRGTLSQAGWYRVAEYKIGNVTSSLYGVDTNSVELIIKRRSGKVSGSTQKIFCSSRYNNQRFYLLSADDYDTTHFITKVRYAYDDVAAYLEIYFDSTDAYEVTFAVNDGFTTRLALNWQAITPVLTSETVSGVTVTTTYDIPANASPVTDLDLKNDTYLKIISSGILSEDPNTTRLPRIRIKHANCPTSDVLYIVDTIFTDDTNEGNEKYQIARGTGGNAYLGFRAKAYGDTWGEWQTLATTADLASYFKNTGGTISGNVTIQKSDGGEISLDVGNTSNDISVIASNAGNVGLYSRKHSKWLAKMDIDGNATFNGAATGNLPLSGGELTAGLREILTISRTSGSLASIVFKGNGSKMGELGFDGADRPAFWDSASSAKLLHHDGNSAKVAIQSTAPADGLWVW